MASSEPDQSDARPLWRTTGICALGAAGVGIFVLLSWWLDAWRSAAMGRSYIPMAPSTAGVMMLLSCGVILHHRWPSHRTARRVAMGSTFIVGLWCLLVWTQFILHADFGIERLMVPRPPLVQNVPIGRMSPLTALVFLPQALALLFELPPLGRRWLWRQLASVLASAAMVTSVVVLLSYAAGAPVLYNGHIIPMSILAAIGSALLSCSIVAVAGSDVFPTTLFRAKIQGADQPVSPWLSRGVIAAFAVLAIASATAGSLYLRHQIAQTRSAVERELAAVAELKSGQVAGWYRERRADAEVILHTPILIAQMRELLETPHGEPVPAGLLVWMESVRERHGYQLLALYDAQGITRASVPSNPDLPNCLQEPGFKTALHATDVVATDLHADPGVAEAKEFARLDLWVPIGAGPSGIARGALRLRINPARFLYPLVQSWPTPSMTAETVLIRREGNEVAFLSELRHRKGAPIMLRLPADSTSTMPAALAVRGQVGLVEGTDYRGERVLAFLGGVPGTPWFLVAKVDEREVFAPLRQEARFVAIAFLVLILGVASAIALLWRHRDVLWLKKQIVVDQARQALADRILYLNKRANDIIILADQHGRILEANDRALLAYGYQPDELRDLRLEDLDAVGTLPDYGPAVDQADTEHGVLIETVHRRKDGSTFPVECSIRTIGVAGSLCRQSIIRDITERKRAEGERETALGFLRLVNSCSDKREMIRATLQFIQETWDCEAVGIRLKEGEDYPYYEYRGFSREFVDMENFLCARDFQGQFMRDDHGNSIIDCMCGNVICGRFDPTRPFFSLQGSFWSNSTTKLLASTTEADRQARTRNRCNGEGYESVALIAMRAGDESLGLLQFNDRRENRFCPELIALWERLAGYLAVALAKFQAEEAQTESDSLLRHITDAIPACVAYVGRDERFRLVNKSHELWFGEDADSIRRRPMREVVGPMGWESIKAYVGRALAGETVSFEMELTTAGAGPRWVHSTYVPDRDSSGLIRGFVAHLADISALKASTEDLRQAKEIAEKASGAKSRFLANMCHELRTPLCGVIGGIDLALADPMLSGQSEYLRLAGESAQGLIRIINDILDLSKIEAGHLSIAEEAFDLRACVSSSTQVLTMEAQRKGLEFVEVVERDVPKTVIGDALRLRQILLNLLGNAVKFTDRGGVEVRVAAGEQAASGKRMLSFTVTDSGIGIPEDKKHLLFQSFSQVDDSTTRKFGGTGLGLAICKQLVERMDGSITVVSQEGMGSAFTVVVPLEEVHIAAHDSADPAVPDDWPDMESRVTGR